jgi:hypothetical protein
MATKKAPATTFFSQALVRYRPGRFPAVYSAALYRPAGATNFIF